jgi:eukaryotic-like serine/threonine-protein kinase
LRTLEDIQPGMTLGRYEFLVPIAKGSRGFSKTVAIKTMLPSLSDDESFEQMFLDEAQIASRIRHPNVVEILDLGEEDDVLYLVMEYVDGEPLGSLRRAAAKHGGIPRSIAVRIVADACAGLHAAHELKDDAGNSVNLVHRDISPQNLLVTYDGVVKIVDFGVAKAAGRTSQATTAGQVKGKPPYMSPEQALGKAVDRRTDVFALGIILYQLTTGKHPFRGESDLVTLQNIVSDKPVVPPRAYDKAFPRSLDAAVMRALDRDRDRRFQSCAEFEEALDAIFTQEIPRARTEDVGKFVAAMFGQKGEDRRRALKDALRLADERAASGGASPTNRLDPLRMSLVGITPPSGTGPIMGPDSGRPGGTPYDAVVAAPAPTGPNKRRIGLALAGVGLVGTALAFASMGGGTSGSEDAPDPAAAATGEAMVEESPVEAPADLPEVDPAASASAEPEVAIAEDEPEVVEEPEPVVTTKPARKPSAGQKKAQVAAAPSPSPSPAPAPKKKNTFVPPPVSNPGF